MQLGNKPVAVEAVKQITVTNGSMVEFDEPLMTIEMVADE